VAAVVALVVSSLAAGTGVFGGPAIAGMVDGTRTTWRAGDPANTPPSVLTAARDSAPMPAPAGLAAALQPLLAVPALGGRVAISVVDVASGQLLYAQSPDAAIVPASTTKLVTAAAVLASRGSTYRIATKVVAGANPGEVVLVGGGDPTLTAGPNGYYPGAARLDDLAAAVKQSLGDTAPTRLLYDVSLYAGEPQFGPGWDPDVASGGSGAGITPLTIDGGRQSPTSRIRVGQPEVHAALAFARLLGVPAGAVAAGTAAKDAKELGKVESPPMVRLVDVMLTDSDNVIAEALARQVALAEGQRATFAASAAAMRAVLVELGVPIEGYGLSDGSGLSRLNRLSPALLTALLTKSAAGDKPELHALFGGLPVGGYSGTLRSRYRTPQSGGFAAGTVRGKTGNLSGVSTIAGVLVDADGRQLAFAIMADAVPNGGSLNAQAALDRAAAAIAACGCR
jgi:D-alanyl-D-alanine carboxypeptidase/D-alanyl-D-alanine-endopeptidase (penicillin-binding protein 4)